MVSSFADAVRSLPDDELAALLRARPDLLVPAPADLSAVAARAQSRMSVTRAVAQLHRFQLEMLDALRFLAADGGAATLDDLIAAAVATGSVDREQVCDAVGVLRRLMLVYGTDDALQVVAAADEVLGPHPAGLGAPAAELAKRAAQQDPAVAAQAGRAAALVGDAARLRRAVMSAPQEARAVMTRLAAGPPVGTVDAGAVQAGAGHGHGTGSGHGTDTGYGTGSGQEPPEGEPGESAAAESAAVESPVAWLVERGLVAATSATTVELPREVGLLLRRDRGPLGELHPAPPQPDADRVARDSADAAGAGQAMTAVQQAEAVLSTLASAPAPVLRSGGLGARELRRLARAVQVAEPTVALFVETCFAAGLLGQTEPSRPHEQPTFRPTSAYDHWANAPLAERWHLLAGTWLTMTRQPALVGRRDSRDRLVNALTEDVERAGAPTGRRIILGVLAEQPAGTVLGADAVRELVGWYAPRWTSGRDEAVVRILDEAASLGLTGLGALTSYGSALLAQARQPPDGEDEFSPPEPQEPAGASEPGPAAAGSGPGPVERLAELLPAPVEEVMVQADLSVVVPGPPEPTLAAELELVTEHESAGGASVHRVTRDSVRRALDAGYTADDLHRLFSRRSRTAVPQALTYLVDDVARAHGGLRVGPAQSYLRSEDEALVMQALADRKLSSLRLVRLAPTVLVSPTTGRGKLVSALRDAGYAPVPEEVGGAAVLVRPRGERAVAHPRPAAPADPASAGRVPTARLLGIIEDLRRVEARTRRSPQARRNGAVPADAAAGGGQGHTDALAVLRQALQDKALVRVGYVDGHGSRTSRLVRPVSIGAGYLRAEDERHDTLHTFALHRITGAELDG